MSVLPLDVRASLDLPSDLDFGSASAARTASNGPLSARTNRQRFRIRPDRELTDGRARRHRSTDGRIRKAVRRIHGSDAMGSDMRSAARLAFLYPACVTYSDSLLPGPLSAVGAPLSAQEMNLDVVLTDLSADGAGILVSARHAPLPRRVSLVIDGNFFTCQVRWTKHVGGSVYRYGLVFRDVRRPAPQESPAADAVATEG